MIRPLAPAARRRVLNPKVTVQHTLEQAVDRLLDGDDRAFDLVYHMLVPRVFSLLMRLARERSVAEDLTQETFERMFQARASLRRGVDIAPWAFTIARNLFCDHVRRARLRSFEPGEVDGYEHLLSRPASGPDEALSARRMAGAVEAVLDGLPDRQAEAFRLVREEGQSLDEAAARLGRTEMAVRLSVYRARTAIREHLAARWEVSA